MHRLFPLSLFLLFVATGARAQSVGNYLSRLELGIGYAGLNLQGPGDSATTRSYDVEGFSLSLGWN